MLMFSFAFSLILRNLYFMPLSIFPTRCYMIYCWLCYCVYCCCLSRFYSCLLKHSCTYIVIVRSLVVCLLLPVSKSMQEREGGKYDKVDIIKLNLLAWRFFAPRVKWAYNLPVFPFGSYACICMYVFVCVVRVTLFGST